MSLSGLWEFAEGRTRILVALVIPAVLAVGGTVGLSILTMNATRELSANVRLTQDLVDGNVRTLSQAQRELLRLEDAVVDGPVDPDVLELRRSLAAQRIQEGTLDYQGRTLGDARLLARSRELAQVWRDGPDRQVQALVANPTSMSGADRVRLSSEIQELEGQYNTLVSEAENVRKQNAAVANNATAGLVSDTRLLLGGLVLTLVALAVLVAGMVYVLYAARRAQLVQTARLREARAQLQRTSVAVQATDNLVVVTDPKGHVEWVNDAFTRRTGYTLEEVEGRSPGRVLQGRDTDPETVRRMRESIRRQEPFTAEVLNYAKDGSRYWVSLDVSPIRDGDVVTGFVGVETDITNRRLTEENLRRAKETAEESAEAKQRFLASMSHEIRTPLNAVIGLTDLLQDTALDEQQRSYVSTAHQSGRHLLAIVNDILDFSALESGELEMESTSTDVRALVQDVCTMFTTKAERRGLSLWWSVDPDVPELVCSDLVRLRQVLINLVGNGLKFTERGGVRIRASYLAAAPLLRPDAETAPGTLVLEVVDTGMGIPADRLSRIFTAFAQGDASTTRTHGGTGLGLAICARIAQRLGGEIQVESTVGEGSSFTFSLPVLGCANGTAGATVGELEDEVVVVEDETHDLRLLLAEDDPVNQMVAIHMLRRLGIEADVAGDGIEALQALSAHRYDVVLMDVNMPNLDGVRATEQLRVRPGPQPRIIALTANAAEGDRERMLAAGMDDYLSKPYTLADLEKILAPVRAG
ncbi:response regulator [Phycicoccus sp. MAQZ13P-2]|uniref:PAS domain-containing hybrid sensor histidine kinase/response regulator n=1 Tax=Phycicoccus mangrovi TaxID=2840470 RepID=UPI001C00489D|nr:ATP-binding protein [Phycicoccus mangrovi]MBT9257328.1 response regulator [Phycicoccus mangrovi]MBT9273383.1 response regulator [Phycicoccus mangrovi]